MATRFITKIGDCEATARSARFDRHAPADNVVTSLRTRFRASAPTAGGLTIRAVYGGREECVFDNRRVIVDDDVYLILNACTEYSTRIIAAKPAHLVSIAFAESTVASVAGVLHGADGALLDAPDSIDVVRLHLSERLRVHDGRISMLVRYLAANVDRDDVRDQLWWDEQLQFLLERIIREHLKEQGCLTEPGPLRQSRRAEMYRRVMLTTDYLLSNYDSPMDLGVLADVACMSRHHLLRSFQLVHGMTPRTLLALKRVAAATRMLRQDLSLPEIARVVGLENRSTLLRLFRRHLAVPPSRARSDANATGLRELLARTRRKRCLIDEIASADRVEDLTPRLASGLRRIDRQNA